MAPGFLRVQSRRSGQSRRVGGLQRQQLLMVLGEALPGPGAGRIIREALQHLMPEGISPGLCPLRFGGPGRQEQTHRCEGMLTPSLTLKTVAAACHQQGRSPSLVGVG